MREVRGKGQKGGVMGKHAERENEKGQEAERGKQMKKWQHNSKYRRREKAREKAKVQVWNHLDLK